MRNSGRPFSSRPGSSGSRRYRGFEPECNPKGAEMLSTLHLPPPPRVRKAIAFGTCLQDASVSDCITYVIARESGRSSNHLIRRGLLDAPLSPEVGLSRLRQLLGGRNRKNPISRPMTRLCFT